MNESDNPYAPPKSQDLLASNAAGLLRMDGLALIVPKGFIFPAICVKSGATTDLMPRKHRKFSWHNPKLALLILLNLLIYLIVAAACSKRGVASFQISQTVASKRKKVLWRNFGIFVVGVVCCILYGCIRIFCAGFDRYRLHFDERHSRSRRLALHLAAEGGQNAYLDSRNPTRSRTGDNGHRK